MLASYNIIGTNELLELEPMATMASPFKRRPTAAFFAAVAVSIFKVDVFYLCCLVVDTPSQDSLDLQAVYRLYTAPYCSICADSYFVFLSPPHTHKLLLSQVCLEGSD